jgi:hypothetical protein
MAEFEEATEDFMNEHEEDDVYYSEQEARAEEQKIEDTGTTDPGAQEVHHYYHYSYPFWFGYPRWYYYPRWNPYPWRYDWGWSVGFGGWAIWGMPSFYFMNWYYGYPYHYYNYPGLACHFSDHYYVHRNSLSSVSTTTERWHQDNRDVIQGRLDPGDPGSREAVRELGKMETQRAAYNRNNPDDKLGRREFLASSEEDYRVLAERANKIRPLKEDRVLTGNPSRSVELSPSEAKQVSDRSTAKPVGREDVGKVSRSRTVSPARTSGSTPPSRSNMDRAVDQHRSGWNKGLAPTPSNRRGAQTAPKQRAPSRPSSRPASPSRSTEKKSTGSSGRRK